MTLRPLLRLSMRVQGACGRAIGTAAMQRSTVALKENSSATVLWFSSKRHLATDRGKAEARQTATTQTATTTEGLSLGLPPHSGVRKEQQVLGGGQTIVERDLHEATLPHPIWTSEELANVNISHRTPKKVSDRVAFYTIQTIRVVYDVSAGFAWGERTEKKWLRRLIFLETVAGVPGMVGAMVRHLKSLRVMKKDHGWIHTLLEEAENERMHLMTFLQVQNPGIMMKLGVIGAQGIYVTAFSLAYLVSPSFCHRLVGYLEEEAVKTYTKCLQDIEDGSIKHWKSMAAPELAVNYWHLPPESATMYDVVLAVRADEAHHRQVNHELASIDEDDHNPYKPGH